MVERKPEKRQTHEEVLAETKGTRILLAMFDLIQATIRQSNRESFNQLVRFWADCLRIHPMSEGDHLAADKLTPWAEHFIEACMERKGDYFGEVFSLRHCADDQSTQLIIPESLVRSINDATVSGIAPDSDRWQKAFDPAARTGRFLVDLAVRYPDRKIALFGVEADLDLYRACLVNMRLYAWNRPYFILCADSLIVDVGLNSPNWRYANLWNPPDWQEVMLTVHGRTCR
ncbi:MAG: hypothetical protein H5T64_10605 [Chloroflexi bacterium]|nr:hypothetical protein [Chloroflexota bacterium]